MERGLAANTVESYRRDLRRYSSTLAGRGKTGLGEVAPADQHRGVPAQVPPIGLDRIRRQPALHDQVLQVAADRVSQRGGYRRLAQLRTWLTGV